MGFFDDNDPFESIVREFFGPNGVPNRRYKREAFIRGEDDERVINIVEDSDYTYIIFELPGFEEEDVMIRIKDSIVEIKIQKKNLEGIKEYLAQKLKTGMSYTRRLPEAINPKNYEYTLVNGILEIKFGKKTP